MNFVSAIKYATINYGIRRKCWQSGAILALGNGSQSCQLYWLNLPKGSKMRSDDSVKLCGPDKSFDLQPEDLAAEDWEVI